MDTKFISNKPWLDESFRLRKAMRITTLFVIALGLVLAILGIVLLAYMEYVVGVTAVVFGILLPVGYIGANILLFAKRRKDFDKNMIVEYHFTDDTIEIIKLSDNFKSKDVIKYSNLALDKIENKSKYVAIKTNNYYSDYIVVRKNDIAVENGEDKVQAVASFVNFLLAKVAAANNAEESTCADNDDTPKLTAGEEAEDENVAIEGISGGDEASSSVNDAEVDENVTDAEVIEKADITDETENANADDGIMTLELVDEEAQARFVEDNDDNLAEVDADTSEIVDTDTSKDELAEDGEVTFEDFTERDEVVDIADEKEDAEIDTTPTDFEVVEEEVTPEFNCEVNSTDTDSSYDDLFKYDDKLVDNDSIGNNVSEPKPNYFEDYGNDDEKDNN